MGGGVNAFDLEGEVPLHQAVTPNNAVDVVRCLVEELGAHVDQAKEPTLLTPLFNAVSSNKVGELIRLGANVSAQDGDGHTVLHNAVARDDVSIEMVKMLLEFGVDKKIEGNDGLTAFDVYEARDMPDPAIMKLLK